MTLSGRSGTILVAALCASVFVNLAAAAYIVTGAGQGFVRQQAGPFPAELRQAFRAELLANRGPVIAALADLRRDRDTLHGIITAPAFDPAAAEAANVTIRRDLDAVLVVVQSALVAAVAKLPDDVRRTIPQLTAGDQFMNALAGRNAADPQAEP